MVKFHIYLSNFAHCKILTIVINEVYSWCDITKNPFALGNVEVNKHF